MVEWKSVLIGFVVAIFLGLLFGILIPLVGFALGIFIAGCLVGLMVKKDPMDGFTHGAITGALSILFLGIIPLLGITLLGSLFGIGFLTGTLGLFFLIIFLVIGTILGATGGIIGSIISPTRKKTPIEKSQQKDISEPINVTPSEKTPEIEFSIDNIMKCLCTNCPVQEKSKCSSEKLLKMQETIKSEDAIIKADDVPGLHCATGRAICQDLNFEEKCLCVQCQIWEDHHLENNKPLGSFCQDGKSH
jgi:hypothetical protein